MTNEIGYEVDFLPVGDGKKAAMQSRSVVANFIRSSAVTRQLPQCRKNNLEPHFLGNLSNGCSGPERFYLCVKASPITFTATLRTSSSSAEHVFTSPSEKRSGTPQCPGLSGHLPGGCVAVFQHGRRR